MPDRIYSILLVDDEESILEIAQSILELEGYIVRTAISAGDAMSVLGNFIPDIIISDVNMPGKSGFEFYKHLRTIPELQNIPFIFLTGNSDVESIKIGKELGSDDYLTKPVDYYILSSVIRGKLRRRDQLKESQSKQINQIKNNLFRLISHEMRTPLTSILGATELLSEPSENLSPEDLTTFLTMLQANSKRLTKMVDDFLLATKIESGEIQNGFAVMDIDINPSDLIIDLEQQFSSTLQTQNIKFISTVPNKIVRFTVFLPYLEDILSRLLDNAIKFSRNGDTVTIASEEQAEDYTFILTDTGTGIPKEKQNLLFDKFQQVNREKLEQQGTGLGLYIAKNLIQLNGGSLRFESEEGKGTSFFATFKKNHSHNHAD